MNNSDQDFKDYLRREVNRYEAEQPVPPSDWDGLQSKMNQPPGNGGSAITRFTGIAAAVAVVAAATGFFYFGAPGENAAEDYKYTERTEQPARPVELNKDADVLEIVEVNKSTEAKDGEPASISSEQTENVDETSEKSSNEDASTYEQTSPRQELDENEDVDRKSQENEDKALKVDHTEAEEPGRSSGVSVTPVKRTFCVDETLEYTINKPVQNLSLEVLTDLSYDINEYGNYIFNEQGIYKFKAGFDVNGNIETDEFAVTVLSKPQTKVIAEMDLVDGGRPQYTFNHESVNYSSIRRWMNGREVDSSNEWTSCFVKRGVYEIKQVAYSAAGCTDTAYKTVTINNDYNLLAPDAFTPNGDGMNDTWLPMALKDPVYEFSLEIRDLRGNLVFKTSDANSEWEGPADATPAGAGAQNTYVWKAVVQYKGATEHYGGTIRVLQ